MSMGSRRTQHVVLFPSPGHGHLVGFLALARLLRLELPDDATTVTLVSTPRNVATLRSSCNDSSGISFHALPFEPSDHGLPAGCESTGSLPVPAFIDFFEAFESLEPAFDAYLSGLVREAAAEEDVCVISDAFAAWTACAARRHGCAHAVLATCGAFGVAVIHALWSNAPAPALGPDDTLRLPLPRGEEELVLHRSQLSPSVYVAGERRDRWTAFYRRLLPHARRTDAVLVNTVGELEPTGLAMVRRAVGDKVPVWAIGPLVARVREDQDDTKRMASAISDDGVLLRWLDLQQPKSVLYISFGSQNTIRREQMLELAAALELTSRPFVWAIRPPAGCSPGDVRLPLPEGFEERARAGNRGVLVRGWAPQLRILAHAATGAFLSHCGWNSVLESLARGVPILGWPLAAEQFYNAKMLAEEWGVCVEVARGNLETSAVHRSRLAEAVEAVMMRDSSAEMRRRVVEVQEVMTKAWAQDGGSSTTALHHFLQAMCLRR
jgi:hypothetical protein